MIVAAMKRKAGGQRPTENVGGCGGGGGLAQVNWGVWRAQVPPRTSQGSCLCSTGPTGNAIRLMQTLRWGGVEADRPTSAIGFGRSLGNSLCFVDVQCKQNVVVIF